jgi:amidase
MNYQDYDALGLAELVRGGEVSARELLAEARSRLERVNSILNAVICMTDDRADMLAARTDLNAPFCGVPFLVKDLMLPIAGYPLSNGSRSMRGYIPDADCDLVERMEQAGLVVFGKTNTPELGASPLTAPVAFGQTRNPWKPERNSGGSSGGSSAAVAARVVPMAYSSDGGGSIRLPASYCGIFGFKPSRGLNKYEDMSRAWGGAVVSHVSTISVRDSAAYLDVVNGRADASYRVKEPPANSYLRSAMRTPDPLKIALITETPIGSPVDRECLAAAEHAAGLCEYLGHRVDPVRWGFDGMELMRAFLTIVFHYTLRDTALMARLLDVEERGLLLELNTRFIKTLGKGVDDARLAWALKVWESVSAEMAKLHQTFDVVLTPTVATPPLHADALDPNLFERFAMRLLIRTGLTKWLHSDRLLDGMVRKSMTLTPYTPVANVTGQPAMSVPLYWDRHGLPHGAHFMAAEGNDSVLFQLAAQLEEAQPWRYRRPDLCA